MGTSNMRATVTNFRGCRSADVPLDGVTMIGGINGAGKSSIAQAVTALLTGTPLIAGITKSQAGMLVSSGTGAGELTLTSEGGNTRIVYPVASVDTTGERPAWASTMATGAESLVDMPTKQRSLYLIELLNTEPTQEDLAAALADVTLDVDALWQEIQSRGWDSAHKVWSDLARERKGAWHEVAGETWGVRKAETWVPPGWSDDLETTSADALSAAVEDCRAVVEGAIAQEAVAADEIARLQALADTAADLEAEQSAVDQEHARIMREGLSAKERYDELPRPPDMQTTTPCPHCGEPVVIAGGVLAKPAALVADDERAAMLQVIADADAALNDLRAAAKSAKARSTALWTQIQAARAAAERLAEIADQPEPDQTDMDAARNALAAAEAHLQAFHVKRRADSLHADIIRAQAVIAVLAPDGIRLTRLSKGMAGLADTLAAACEAAKWPAVSVSKDMAITYGGSPLALLSAGELYRVRAVLAVACATYDNSQAVVFDTLGEQFQPALDKVSLNGLYRLARHAPCPCVLTVTVNAPEDMPKPGNGAHALYVASGAAQLIE